MKKPYPTRLSEFKKFDKQTFRLCKPSTWMKIKKYLKKIFAQVF